MDSQETTTPVNAVIPTLAREFLRGSWHHVTMLNYPTDPRVLAKYIPRGAELDLWNGQAYLSMVGFLFRDTRVRGVPVPCHRNFEEVNLRTYVRRKHEGEWRRGVTFIKEIVPRMMIAWVARQLYNENYVSMPMRHRIDLPVAGSPAGEVAYEWYYGERWQRLSADIAGNPAPLVPGSENEFIAEHYWGYCRQRNGSTLEYRVEHPPWRAWVGSNPQLDCDATALYGAELAPFLQGPPLSTFVAEGSPIIVREGVRLPSS
jgi:uncharacterized protein YqjF (DUF2071 family)